MSSFSTLRLSTQDIPPQDRVPFWKEQFGRGMLRVEIEQASDTPFRAAATLQMLPGIRMIECAGSLARYDRTPGHVRDGDDSISLVVNLGVRGAVRHEGRDANLRVGAAMPILSDKPATLTATSYLGLLFPRAALAERIKHIEAAIRVIDARSEPLSLLLHYLRYVKRRPNLLQTPKMHDALESHIHDLAALAIGAPGAAEGQVRSEASSAIAEARLATALADIAVLYDAPNLSIASVAARQKISARYLQRIFETTGQSFTAYVTELRLQKAFRLLTENAGSHLRVSEVALQSGFSDLSHFNRTFRSRYGDTPTAVRAARFAHAPSR